MLDTLFIKLHMALLTLVGAIVPARRTASARRGAEFIEVALYAAIILAIMVVFRSGLTNAFNSIISRIQGALNS